MKSSRLLENLLKLIIHSSTKHACVVVDKHEEPGGDHDNDDDEGEVELLEAEQDGEAQEPQDARRLGERVECDCDVLREPNSMR